MNSSNEECSPEMHCCANKITMNKIVSESFTSKTPPNWTLVQESECSGFPKCDHYIVQTPCKPGKLVNSNINSAEDSLSTDSKNEFDNQCSSDNDFNEFVADHKGKLQQNDFDEKLFGSQGSNSREIRSSNLNDSQKNENSKKSDCENSAIPNEFPESTVHTEVKNWPASVMSATESIGSSDRHNNTLVYQDAALKLSVNKTHEVPMQDQAHMHSNKTQSTGILLNYKDSKTDSNVRNEYKCIYPYQHQSVTQDPFYTSPSKANEIEYLDSTTHIEVDTPSPGEYQDFFYIHSSRHHQQTNNLIEKAHLRLYDSQTSKVATDSVDKDNRKSELRDSYEIGGKVESQDDGYETSAGETLTQISHLSSSSASSSSPLSAASSAVLLRNRSVFTSANSIMIPVSSEIKHIHTRESPSKVDVSGFGTDASNTKRVIPHQIRYLSDKNMCNKNRYNLYSAGTKLNNISNAPSNATLVDPVDISNSIEHGQLNNKASFTDELNLTSQITADQPPKKRGRKKKLGSNDGSLLPPLKLTSIPKERKKHDRFNGMTEEEVSKRSLPDHLTDNLDIIIIGINPGLFAAYKGHHYAGPGNHFWKCLYLSGLIHEQMSAEEDYKLLDFGIGFTNMVQRPTKGSADLTRKEIKEGCRILLEKLQRFRPKIAVFNGKLIFEVFSGKKDFLFGRQDNFVDGTNTYMWVMPSSSARCAQLPRAADKVPFYVALKKFRDFLNGLIPHIDDIECVFNDSRLKLCCEIEPKTKTSMYENVTDLRSCHSSNTCINRMRTDMTENDDMNISLDKEVTKSGSFDSNLLPVVKKKRGRPKKNKCLECMENVSESFKKESISSLNSLQQCGLKVSVQTHTNSAESGILPKKKRGRPKKLKTVSTFNNDGTLGEFKLKNDAIENKNCISQSKNELEIMNNNHCSSSASVNTQKNSKNINTYINMAKQSLLSSSIMHSPSTAASSYCSYGSNMDSTPYVSSINFHSNTNLNTFYNSYSDQVIEANCRQLFYNPNSYQASVGLQSEFSSENTPTSHIASRPQSLSQSLGCEYYEQTTHSNESRFNEMHYTRPISDGEKKKRSDLLSKDSTVNSCNSEQLLSSALSENGSESNFNSSDLHLHQNTTATEDQKNRVTDVSAKSLSVLESLVYQIPTLADISCPSSRRYLQPLTSPTPLSSNSSQSISDSLHGFSSASSEQFNMSSLFTNYLSPMQHQASVLVSPPASPLLSAAVPIATAMLISPHHNFSNPLKSCTPICESFTTASLSQISSISTPTNCSSIDTPFGSSPFPANSFPSSSVSTTIRTDSMVESSSSNVAHQLINDCASNVPMFADQSQAFLPVSSLYHAHHTNPYPSHSIYQGYTNASQDIPLALSTSPISSSSPLESPVLQSLHPPAPQSMQVLHLSSPNYPYGYSNSSTYKTLHHSAHHPHHPVSATAYLTPHPSIFEHLKPDYSYGGY